MNIKKEWEKGSDWFIDDNSIPDLIIHDVTYENWNLFFKWIKKKDFVKSVNCYVPIGDKNISEIPDNIHELLRNKDFNCHIGIKKDSVSLMIHYYIESTIDCDIYTEEINSISDYKILLSFLDELNSNTKTEGFTMNPEGSTDFIFKTSMGSNLLLT